MDRALPASNGYWGRRRGERESWGFGVPRIRESDGAQTWIPKWWNQHELDRVHALSDVVGCLCDAAAAMLAKTDERSPRRGGFGLQHVIAGRKTLSRRSKHERNFVWSPGNALRKFAGKHGDRGAGLHFGAVTRGPARLQHPAQSRWFL